MSGGVILLELRGNSAIATIPMGSGAVVLRRASDHRCGWKRTPDQRTWHRGGMLDQDRLRLGERASLGMNSGLLQERVAVWGLNRNDAVEIGQRGPHVAVLREQRRAIQQQGDVVRRLPKRRSKIGCRRGAVL